jgi:hypothetical protein
MAEFSDAEMVVAVPLQRHCGQLPGYCIAIAWAIRPTGGAIE